LQSQSKGDGLPGWENDFETARLSVFATSGPPGLWTNVFSNCGIRVETAVTDIRMDIDPAKPWPF
jgi:hypothetical protein